MSLNSFPEDPRPRLIQELKRDSEPKEQLRFEFIDDNALLLQKLQMNIERVEDLEPLIDSFSYNEKKVVEKYKKRIHRLEEEKEEYAKHHFIKMVQISDKEIESLDLKNHFDYTIYEYSQKHHENLFATKEMIMKIENLKEAFPNFNKVIDYVLKHALFSLKKQIPMFLPAININGDPSIGKTFFVKRLSKVLASDFYSLPVSTLLSSHELTGLSRYWGNAGTGLIFNNIVKKAKYAQSVMLLDEICKVTYNSIGNGSNIANALISIMDKEQAKEFTETCLDIEIDVSRMLVFSTSNQVEKLPDVLRSRLVNFNVSKPDKTQLNKIINSMVKNILQELQIKEDEMPLVIERETSDLFYGADLRDVREILKNHILTEYIDSGVESDIPYTLYH